MPNNNCHNRLLSLLSAQEWHLDRLYAEYSRRFGSIFRGFNGNITKAQKRQLDKVLESFRGDLNFTLKTQIENSFSLSNLCNDKMASEYLKGMEINEAQTAKIFAENSGAAAAFVSRSVAGLDLSDRVWELSKQTEDSLHVILESGVLNGRGSADMATDLKKYLKEPDKRFRRIRNDQGKLTLSTPAKNYHPGQGVYRSSYQNALRLSRNEVNIAYRTNDFNRRKNMKFVMGHKVQLSAAHPRYDICDHLVGNYPKRFFFTGWHPNCLCFSTAVLLPRRKMKEYLGGGKIDQRHAVKTIPKPALDYLNDNADTIKGWKSKPYFIRDNFKSTKTGFAPKI